MPKPRRYVETLYLRLPKGTRARIERLSCGQDRLSDVQRRVVLMGIAVLETERESMAQWKEKKDER